MTKKKRRNFIGRLKAKNAAAPSEAIGLDREREQMRRDRRQLDAKYAAALSQIGTLEKRLELLAATTASHGEAWDKAKRVRHGKATAILALSDWHCEQSIKPERVSGLNEYNLDVAERRIRNVFDRALLLLEDARHLVPIENLIVWLGGDIIHGAIHDEYAADNTLHPFEACRWAADRIESGLRGLIEHAAADILVVTSHGNHGRTSKKMPSATAAATSYEHNSYLAIRSRFGPGELDWQIGEGYFNYVDVYDFPIRFHHGDRVRWTGGVNGIGVPAYRFISGANTKRPAYLDVFGHFHRFGWPGGFVHNGSLNGVDEYSEGMAGDAEPKQAFIVIDKARGCTRVLPVYAD